MLSSNKRQKSVGIIGAGASGCICAYFLLKFGIDVTLFDKANPLRTLLPTGGGRCNLAHAEFDFRELARNYPRGEKFLYSVFSQFSTSDTIELFDELGVKTYVQENGRIFPKSNSSKDVKNKILNNITSANFITEKVCSLEKLNNGFKVITNKSEYYFTHIVLAIGGHSGYSILENLGINIISPKPSLVGFRTKEDFGSISGSVLKNVKHNNIVDDILFTHFGVSGPLIYTLSSLNAFKTFPYKISIDLAPDFIDFQDELNKNPHKEIKNILAKFLPHKIVSFILKDFDDSIKAHKINGNLRDLISNKIHNFEIEIVGVNVGEETVTAGGVDLNEINSKTMETKRISNLFCIGEVLNIDGFCGGFNLQNAWSTAYVASLGINES